MQVFCLRPAGGRVGFIHQVRSKWQQRAAQRPRPSTGASPLRQRLLISGGALVPRCSCASAAPSRARLRRHAQRAAAEERGEWHCEGSGEIYGVSNHISHPKEPQTTTAPPISMAQPRGRKVVMGDLSSSSIRSSTFTGGSYPRWLRIENGGTAGASHGAIASVPPRLASV